MLVFFAPQGWHGQNPSDLGFYDGAYLFSQLIESLVCDKFERLADHCHQVELTSVDGNRIFMHFEQVQLVSLEKHARLLIIEHFSVLGERLRAERQELGVITKEDGGGGLLVITLIARIEHFDAGLACGVSKPGCNTVAGSTSAKVNGNDMGKL